MAGLTDDWIDLGAQRRVTLTNLDPGDHVLEVRAANADSRVEREPLRLTIHRDPAPWASPWAYAALRARAARASSAHRIQRHRQKFREMVAGARAPRGRGAAAHARARGEQSPARRSGAREERLPRPHEPRAAHADERRRRHDRAADAHGAVGDAVAPHEDDPLVGADPAADRQRLARPVEDPRRQGRAREAADRSRAGARGVHEHVCRRRRQQGHRARSSARRRRASACCSAIRCACGRC